MYLCFNLTWDSLQAVTTPVRQHLSLRIAEEMKYEHNLQMPV